MKLKSRYRVSNWKSYNRALINRGNLTLWIDDEVLQNWYNCARTGKKGRPSIYSDSAIECALMIRQLFKLPLRAVQGFLEGLISMLDVSIQSPSYITLSRRSAKLNINLGRLNPTKPAHIVIDATGLKVYGEGEWKIRVDGKSTRRTWRKFHIAIDRDSFEIASVSLTESNVHDSMATKNLLDQINNAATVTGDKGYDNRNAYNPIAIIGAKAIIPPRSGAALKTKNLSPGDLERNRNILEKRFLGQNLWKYASGYSKRILVETSIGRYKQIIGSRLHAKNLKNQQTEVRIAAKILNRMTHLGMPRSYKI